MNYPYITNLEYQIIPANEHKSGNNLQSVKLSTNSEVLSTIDCLTKKSFVEDSKISNLPDYNIIEYYYMNNKIWEISYLIYDKYISIFYITTINSLAKWEKDGSHTKYQNSTNNILKILWIDGRYNLIIPWIFENMTLELINIAQNLWKKYIRSNLRNNAKTPNQIVLSRLKEKWIIKDFDLYQNYKLQITLN